MMGEGYMGKNKEYVQRLKEKGYERKVIAFKH
jgi:hypothetical protein